MAIVVASLHGAPGASTLACALAGRVAADGRQTLLVEADPDGGVLAARLGLKLQPSLTDLAGAARSGIDPAGIWQFTQPLGRTLHVVVAHPCAEQTTAALRAAGAHLARALGELDDAVVIDVGRLRPGSPLMAVLEAADRVVIVVRPVLPQIMSVLHGVDWLVGRARLGLVLVGAKPYSPRQVSDVTGIEVLGSVVDDAVAVDADPFASSTKRRDAWSVGIAGLVDRLGLAAGGKELSVACVDAQ